MIQKAIPIKHFFMVRHGQTIANADRIMAGSLDSPLTDHGRKQAQSVQKAIKNINTKPVRIIHSNLSRARDTATIINEALNLPMHEDPNFAEMDAGDWEGAPYKECQSLFKGWVDPPNGEGYEAFFQRIKMAKIHALQNNEPPLIVSHGGVFRAFLKLYDIHSEGVQNCKLYEFYPKNTPQDGVFPWQVWRYDVEESVKRVEVNFYDKADSEIAR